MASFFVTRDQPVTNGLLNLIAHLPTPSLLPIIEPALFKKLQDTDFMRIATLLAEKSYNEGGCPIGGVIIDNVFRQIIGKGHNTLVQDGDPYNLITGKPPRYGMPDVRISAKRQFSRL